MRVRIFESILQSDLLTFVVSVGIWLATECQKYRVRRPPAMIPWPGIRDDVLERLDRLTRYLYIVHVH